jgi:hypothetical protein
MPSASIASTVATGKAQPSDAGQSAHDSRVCGDAFVGHHLVLTAAGILGTRRRPGELGETPTAQQVIDVVASVVSAFAGGTDLGDDQAAVVLAAGRKEQR